MADAATDENGSPPPEGAGDPAPPSTEDPLSHSSLPAETIMHYLFNNGLSLLSEYGWYILLALVVVYFAWTKLKPHFYQWQKKREEQIEEQNFDPVRAEKYQEAMLKAREKMQRDLNEKAILHQEQKEKKDTEARDERIKHWEEFKVVTTRKAKPKDSWKPPSRQDYFPLGGSGGGGGYRPPRRTVGRGG